ncbi:MAG TPA: L-fucose:H+ symporter permease [Chryseolinea sp.]|nr:L-fucose:H+ symporter permease [Chryseolinea sp.]
MQQQQQRKNYAVAFAMVTTLFFLWAFLHNINPILIPHLKKACQLTDTESSFIDIAVYLGYFAFALPAGWLMHKYGYKKSILMGLFLFSVGALLFLPAASARSYTFFLFALFIQAAGATFLETVANPYVTKLGDKSTSERRLNLAQSFNGVGAFVAPLIGRNYILSGIEHSDQELSQMSPQQLTSYLNFEASTIKIVYLVIAAIVGLVFIFFALSKLPEVKEEDSDEQHSFSMRVFRHSHVTWAVIAEFCYVGTQVGVGSFFIRFSKFVGNMGEKEAAFVWGAIGMVGFMVGRYVGTFLMKYIPPAKLLATYAMITVLLLTISLVTTGNIAIYSLLAVPFFLSIMFPTIFALGIKGLGEESKIASSFLVMSIVGGAVVPVIMAAISDATGSIQKAYIVPIASILVILFFGLRGYKIRNPQLPRTV